MVGQALIGPGWEISSSCETTSLIETDCWRCCCLPRSSRAARGVECSVDLLSKDAEWFSRPGRLFIRNVSIDAPPLTPTSRSLQRIWSAPRAIARAWRRPAAPADANAATDDPAARAAPLDHGNGGAWSYRMRRRARHRRARQRQSVQQSARRPRGGRQLFAGPARRNLHLHRRPPDLDRARAGRWSSPSPRSLPGSRRRRNRRRRRPDAFTTCIDSQADRLSRRLRHIANSPPAIVPRRAATRLRRRRAPC